MDIFAHLESPAQAPDNPQELFRKWLAEAEKAEPEDPGAMALATVGADGRPGLRMVLLKGFDERGFVFFSNRESRKGQDLAAHPAAALCFHWKSLRRQVRVEGAVEWVSEAESDAYYKTRSAGSRIGAWASAQSRPLENRAVLVQRVAEMEEKFAASGGAVPRPAYWGGYRIKPEAIEFWHDGVDRLHTRIVYTRQGDGAWARAMLYP